jgi:D-sedoheptulose 7-phosphate isomerase
MKKLFEVHEYFEKHNNIAKRLDLAKIISAANLIRETVDRGGTIFTMGNGGSAHNASHFITDWAKMSNIEKSIKLKGMCLNDNIGMITAYANDINFEDIFTGQLKIYLQKNDLVIVVSGSGNSQNIINALDYANNNNATTLAFLGYDGGKAISIAQNHILVPSFDMQICEDIHLKIGHIIMKFLCDFKIED